MLPADLFWRVWFQQMARPASFLHALLPAACLVAAPVSAHGPYTDWQRPDVGGSCCNDADCAAAPDVRISGGRYEVLFQDRWIGVPPEKVLRDVQNPDGHPHLCAVPRQDGGVTVFCFLPPSAT